MINVLDLRAQVSPPQNGRSRNAGSDGDAFGTLFDEDTADDARHDELRAEACVLPGPSTVPISRPSALAIGDGTTSLTEGRCDAVDDVGAQTGAAHGVPVSEMSDSTNRHASKTATAQEMPNLAELEPAKIGSNTAKSVNFDEATPNATRDGNAMPVTVTQGQVTTASVAPPAMLTAPMNAIVVRLSDEANADADPDAHGTVATSPGKPGRDVLVPPSILEAAGNQAEHDLSDRLPEGLDRIAGENDDAGLLGARGTATSLHMAGPGSAALSQQGNSVAAAIIAAIPLASAGAERVGVILSPAELGRVQMEFRADGDGMRVFLTAERPETLDLLRRHADELAAELRSAGYSGASLSFGHWGQPQDEARHAGQPVLISQAESRIPTPPLTFAAAPMPGQGLDLRI